MGKSFHVQYEDNMWHIIRFSFQAKPGRFDQSWETTVLPTAQKKLFLSNCFKASRFVNRYAQVFCFQSFDCKNNIPAATHEQNYQVLFELQIHKEKVQQELHLQYACITFWQKNSFKHNYKLY